jgi:Clp amino terminal domain, pathogenicity island component
MLGRMNARGKMLALALAAAVVLASGAYALGSQAGGGSATAQSNDSGSQTRLQRDWGPPPGLGNMADQLGVSEDQLQDALESLRSEQEPPNPDDLTKELAAALGVSQADLKAALKKVAPKRGGKLCGPGERKLERRFAGRGPGGPPPRGGMMFFGLAPGMADALAKQLGIDADKVEDALDTVREKLAAQAQERHAAFQQKLADKLGISVDKVKDSFDAGPMRFERRHP